MIDRSDCNSAQHSTVVVARGCWTSVVPHRQSMNIVLTISLHLLIKGILNAAAAGAVDNG